MTIIALRARAIEYIKVVLECKQFMFRAANKLSRASHSLDQENANSFMA